MNLSTLCDLFIKAIASDTGNSPGIVSFNYEPGRGWFVVQIPEIPPQETPEEAITLALRTLVQEAEAHAKLLADIASVVS